MCTILLPYIRVMVHFCQYQSWNSWRDVTGLTPRAFRSRFAQPWGIEISILKSCRERSRQLSQLDRGSHGIKAELKTSSPDEYSSPRIGDQVSQVATILSNYSEAITAINVEIFKAALVGTSAEAGRSSDQGDSINSPEVVLEALHDAVLSVLQDRVHLMGKDERESWSKATWDVYHLVQPHIQRLMFELHSLGAEMGSSTAASQAANCASHGLLVPQDSAAALHWFKKASDLGSIASSLKCGTMFFHGQSPAEKDATVAFGYFTRALEQADAEVKAQQERIRQKEGTLDALDGAQQSALSEENQAYLDVLKSQRDEALAWLGRCYATGAGVPHNIGLAAQMFRQSNSLQDLEDLAKLKKQLDSVDFSGLLESP